MKEFNDIKKLIREFKGAVNDEHKKNITINENVGGNVYTIKGRKVTMMTDKQLTNLEKDGFISTIDDFIERVSGSFDLYNFVIFPDNVEFSGKINDFELDFHMSIKESDGIYIDTEKIKVTSDFVELVIGIRKFYINFKSNWEDILNEIN